LIFRHKDERPAPAAAPRAARRNAAVSFAGGRAFSRQACPAPG